MVRHKHIYHIFTDRLWPSILFHAHSSAKFWYLSLSGGCKS